MHVWVNSYTVDPDAVPQASMTRADRQLVAILTARAQNAEEAGTRAMATGDWTAAAELEEERVVRQHELAELLLERRLGPRTDAPASSTPELDSAE